MALSVDVENNTEILKSIQFEVGAIFTELSTNEVVIRGLNSSITCLNESLDLMKIQVNDNSLTMEELKSSIEEQLRVQSSELSDHVTNLTILMTTQIKTLSKELKTLNQSVGVRLSFVTQESSIAGGAMTDSISELGHKFDQLSATLDMVRQNLTNFGNIHMVETSTSQSTTKMSDVTPEATVSEPELRSSIANIEQSDAKATIALSIAIFVLVMNISYAIYLIYLRFSPNFRSRIYSNTDSIVFNNFNTSHHEHESELRD